MTCKTRLLDIEVPATMPTPLTPVFLVAYWHHIKWAVSRSRRAVAAPLQRNEMGVLRSGSSERRKPPHNLWHRILRGDDAKRRTRFHDEGGHCVPVAGVLFVPSALVTTILCKTIGFRPVRPWFSYRVQTVIAREMRASWSVLEFGSGMSTCWFARRCQSVMSIEHDERWADVVRTTATRKGLANVRVVLREPAEYCDLSWIPNASVDFVLVDGINRAGCVRAVLPKLRSRGWLYLDNSDRYVEASMVVEEAARSAGTEAREFTDFAPTSLVANRGMLVQL